MDGILQLQVAELSKAVQTKLITEKSSTPELQTACARDLWRKGRVKRSWEGCLGKVAQAQALKDR